MHTMCAACVSLQGCTDLVTQWGGLEGGGGNCLCLDRLQLHANNTNGDAQAYAVSIYGCHSNITQYADIAEAPFRIDRNQNHGCVPTEISKAGDMHCCCCQESVLNMPYKLGIF